jgi:uncharacterized protein (TIGR00645 family)
MSKNKKIENFLHFVEISLYSSRWMLAIMYLGMIAAMGAYTFRFLIELVHMCTQFRRTTEETLLIVVLSLVDITMIGNLIYIIMLGGYSIFVREIKTDEYQDKPRWLNNINSGTLKIKMGVSLIGVSSVHLLKIFVDSEQWTWHEVGKKCTIHGMFIISTIALAWVDSYLHPHHIEESKKEGH